MLIVDDLFNLNLLAIVDDPSFGVYALCYFRDICRHLTCTVAVIPSTVTADDYSFMRHSVDVLTIFET